MNQKEQWSERLKHIKTKEVLETEWAYIDDGFAKDIQTYRVKRTQTKNYE